MKFSTHEHFGEMSNESISSASLRKQATGLANFKVRGFTPYSSILHQA
jgi:hypothetical protein